MRFDKRAFDELRPVTLEPGYLDYPEGSCLIRQGNTWVICTASVEEGVPPFLEGAGQGWVTAEYNMLPRATKTRSPRERGAKGIRGRTEEIQRMIGRSLRAVTDLKGLNGFTVRIDCDVLQADGGTRTASVTGAFVALAKALLWLKNSGQLQALPLWDYIAAVSTGIYDEEVLLDLCYKEDSQARVDVNLALTGQGKWVEIQGTAEKDPFSSEEMDEMIRLGRKGIEQLIQLQKEALEGLQLGSK